MIELDRLEVKDASFFTKLKLVHQDSMEKAIIKEVTEPDASLTTLEQLRYVILPAALKTGQTLLKGTMAGNIFAVAANTIPNFPPLRESAAMEPTKVNIITNVIGFLLAILEPVKSYLTSQPFEWGTFVACLLGAAVAYYTGKSAKNLESKM